MAEKKFAGVNGAVETAEVNADFESAKVFDKLRVGELGVYFRDGLKTRYIPYDYIDRAFIRVQETRGRMCCGQANWYYYRIEAGCAADRQTGTITASCLSTAARSLPTI